MTWKSAGYFISIVSVLLLGSVAWPKPDAPAWHLPALLAGMAASIGGMALRWIAHRTEEKRFARIEAALDIKPN